MLLLADENIDWLIVEWLRVQGHDVLWIPEFASGQPDEWIIERAVSDRRVLITFDLDFGELVFRRRLNVEGVLLLRLTTRSTAESASLFQRIWGQVDHLISGHFIVATNTRIRVRPLPGE